MKIRFLMQKTVSLQLETCRFPKLSEHARKTRRQLATPHSQRSVARISAVLAGSDRLWFEDLIETCRVAVPTETQVMVKREDEQAFAELNPRWQTYGFPVRTHTHTMAAYVDNLVSVALSAQDVVRMQEDILGLGVLHEVRKSGLGTRLQPGLGA